MYKRIILISALSLLFTGCASVPMANGSRSDAAKQFNPPAPGKAGLYVFRDSMLGAALKKDIWVDGDCVGESAPNVFFFREVEGDKEHTLATESEFSPNTLKLYTKAGDNYFVRQYIKLGLFVGGANLEIVDAAQGQAALQKLKLAEGGNCSK